MKDPQSPKGMSGVTRLDVRFAHSRDGRPEIYDFLWDHVGGLFSQGGEKKVRIRFHSGWEKGFRLTEREHLLQKIMNDQRFNLSLTSGKGEKKPMEWVVRAKDLDDILNAYNVFFDGTLTHLRMEGESVSIDFSGAGKHEVVIHAPTPRAETIADSIRLSFTRPRIRTIRFGIDNPLHNTLLHARSRNG